MSPVTMTLIAIFSLAGLIYLAVRSGERYRHSDAHSHATEYAGIIREGHGPLTAFLAVAFIVVFLWTAVYFIQHGKEFLMSGGETQAAPRDPG